MKSIIIVSLLFVNICLIFSQSNQNVFLSNHRPSLLINKKDESKIKDAVAASSHLSTIQNTIFQESNKVIGLPTLTYEKKGRRLLDVSRECLRRVYFLSYSYRMTGDSKYAKRAEEELLAVSAFKDWNPPHFIDVAEMTMGVAIGYDWLYEYLSQSSRNVIADAIIEKGLKPSTLSENSFFLKTKNNWNQVGNAGMLFGAIAIRDKDPILAKTIVERSLKSLPISMATYEPEGIFDEGYMYWGYGTSFNVMLINAAEKFMGEELFPLDKMPGFVKSATYILHMVGSTKYSFNYGDCSSKMTFNPATFWFANRTSNTGLLFNEMKQISSNPNSLKQIRLLPSALIWSAGLDLKKKTVPDTNFFIGKGANPVCMMRTSWTDPKAIYVGVKMGSPAVSHGHMDVGSFVMDAMGERWATDLGMADYNTLESQGLKIFDMNQNSDRWKIFFFTNLSHNTLAFNDSLQNVNSSADFQSFTNTPTNMSCTTNLSAVYVNQVKSAKRTVALQDNSFVRVTDEIVTASATNMRWTMITEAIPEFNHDKGEIVLTKNGKKVILRVDSSAKFKLKTWESKTGNNIDDLYNEKTIIGFESELSANRNVIFNVKLIPQKK